MNIKEKAPEGAYVFAADNGKGSDNNLNTKHYDRKF